MDARVQCAMRAFTHHSPSVWAAAHLLYCTASWRARLPLHTCSTRLMTTEINLLCPMWINTDCMKKCCSLYHIYANIISQSAGRYRQLSLWLVDVVKAKGKNET